MRRTVLGLAAAALLLAACGDSGDSASSAASTTAGGRTTTAAAAGGARLDAGNSTTAGPVPAAADDQAIVRAQAAGLKQIYTGSMQIEVGRSVFDASLEAKRIVTDAGGFVFSERSVQRENDAQPTSDITFKIPPERFTAVLDEFARRLGTERGRQVSADDVTAQFIDLEARLKTAEVSLERVRKLLGEAKTVTEILSLEGEVAKRETQVEQLKGQLNQLSRRVEFATVTLTLAQKIVTASKKDDAVPNPLDGLKAGGRAFLGTAKIVLLVLAVLLPFLPIALLGWWAGRRFIWPKRRPASPPSSAPPAEEDRQQAEAVSS